MRGDSRSIEDCLPLKPNYFHILVALAKGDRHGYAVMQEVLERTKGEVRLWPATLYGSIRRMEKAGLIAETSTSDMATDDDPRRRYYTVTEFGRRVLAAEADRLQALAEMARRRSPSEAKT